MPILDMLQKNKTSWLRLEYIHVCAFVFKNENWTTHPKFFQILWKNVAAATFENLDSILMQ